jgi:hypothetical protein
MTTTFVLLARQETAKFQRRKYNSALSRLQILREEIASISGIQRYLNFVIN